MQAGYRTPFRGMQVHAVPEADRALDTSGRKLPWGYDADPSSASVLEKREPVEKGPFGRSQRRSRSGLTRSRSRTAEPRREEERVKAEQLASEDAVFGSLRKVQSKDDSGGRREALGEVDANAVAQPAVGGRDQAEQEATEVMLYGFGVDLQWSALDFYERVSGGSILEDYERQPPGPRYDISRSLRRAPSSRSLSRAALRKKNTFAGGDHWIKVTFDSRGAAELACARSPHIVKGYLVYAEPYQGRAPGRDEAIPATQAGAMITDPAMPSTFSTNLPGIDGSPNGSSTTTATSATATTQQQSLQHQSRNLQPSANDPFTPSRPSQSSSAALTSSARPQTPSNTLRHRPSRALIEGATPITLLPASAAILPKQPKPSWSQWMGTSEVIGSTVPKREDGSFDFQRASLYWKVFWWIDQTLGTDLCGMKGD